MTPYYSDDGITIYHADCRDVLATLSADVVITDPPYGVDLQTKRNDYRNSEYFDDGESSRAAVLYQDDSTYVRALIVDVMPLVLAIGRALIFPGSAMLWAYPEPRALGCVYLPSGAGRSAWGFQCMQPILYYGADPVLAAGKGSRPNSFRTEQPNRDRFDHPCPKPLSWMSWAVLRASCPGETVVDPFMGTGTTLRAAKDLGRQAIGIEMQERYCEIAVNRLRQRVLPIEATR